MRISQRQRKWKMMLPFVAVIALFSSCKPLEQDIFKPDYQNVSLLPKLTAWIDQPSFENAYGANSYSV